MLVYKSDREHRELHSFPTRRSSDLEEQVREGLALRPWEELREQVVLGAAGFARGVKRRVGARWEEHTSELQSRLHRVWRVPLELKTVIAAVEKARGELWEDFRDRHG